MYNIFSKIQPPPVGEAGLRIDDEGFIVCYTGTYAGFVFNSRFSAKKANIVACVSIN